MTKSRNVGTPRGPQHHAALLTEDIVRACRDEYDSSPRKYGLISYLARRYGVHVVTMHQVIHRDTWAYLERGKLCSVHVPEAPCKPQRRKQIELAQPAGSRATGSAKQ